MRRRGLLVTMSLVVATGALLAPAPAVGSLVWDDDPCELNGGQLAVAPDISHASPATHPIAYAACADGVLLRHGHDGKGTYEPVPGIAADSFVDVASTADDTLYAVTADGWVVARGASPERGNLYPSPDPVVALEMTSTGAGYWIVTAAGEVAGFGDAPDLAPAADVVVGAPVIAFASSGDDGGWLVTELGEVVPVGEATDHGSVTDRVAAGDAVVGIVADRATAGFWVVTRAGAVIPAGGAPGETDTARCRASRGGTPPFTGAVGDTSPDASAPLWLYTVNGAICGFDPHD